MAARFVVEGLTFESAGRGVARLLSIDYSFTVPEITIPSKVVHDGSSFVVAEIGYEWPGLRTSTCSVRRVVVPACVKRFDSAFYGMATLERVDFQGDSELVEICNSTFEDSGLRFFQIPPKVVRITDLAGLGSAGGNERFPVEGRFVIDGASHVLLLDNEGKESVEIPASVRAIAPGAFFGRSKLKTVTFAAGVLKVIGAAAFAGTSVNEIRVPASVVEVHAQAFSGCPLLKTLRFQGSQLKKLGPRVAWYSGVAELDLDGLVLDSAPDPGAFAGIAKVTSGSSSAACRHIEGLVLRPGDLAAEKVEIPAGATEIHDQAFEGSRVKELTFAGGKLKVIGAAAFADTPLASLKLPSGTQEIRALAFAGTELTEVEIPAGVQVIGPRAFAGSKLAKVTFAAGSVLRSCAADAFEGTAIEAIRFPVGVPRFELVGCGSLKKKQVEFESDVVDGSGLLVTGGILVGLTKWSEELVVPATVKGISPGLLQGTGVKKVSFASGSAVPEIPDHAFEGSELKSISLPASITRIGEAAFAGTRLEAVTFAERCALSVIGCRAFSNVPLTKVTFPGSLREICDGAFEGSGLLEVAFAPPRKLEKIGVGAFRGTKLTNLVLPGGVKVIGDGAFEESALEKLTLSKRLEKVGARAFRGTNLSYIAIPGACMEIGARAFEGSRLSGVKVEGDSRLRRVGEGAFAQTQMEPFEFGSGVQAAGAFGLPRVPPNLIGRILGGEAVVRPVVRLVYRNHIQDESQTLLAWWEIPELLGAEPFIDGVQIVLEEFSVGPGQRGPKTLCIKRIRVASAQDMAGRCDDPAVVPGQLERILRKEERPRAFSARITELRFGEGRAPVRLSDGESELWFMATTEARKGLGDRRVGEEIVIGEYDVRESEIMMRSLRRRGDMAVGPAARPPPLAPLVSGLVKKIADGSEQPTTFQARVVSVDPGDQQPLELGDGGASWWFTVDAPVLRQIEAGEFKVGARVEVMCYERRASGEIPELFIRDMRVIQEIAAAPRTPLRHCIRGITRRAERPESFEARVVRLDLHTRMPVRLTDGDREWWCLTGPQFEERLTRGEIRIGQRIHVTRYETPGSDDIRILDAEVTGDLMAGIEEGILARIARGEASPNEFRALVVAVDPGDNRPIKLGDGRDDRWVQAASAISEMVGGAIVPEAILVVTRYHLAGEHIFLDEAYVAE